MIMFLFVRMSPHYSVPHSLSTKLTYVPATPSTCIPILFDYGAMMASKMELSLTKSTSGCLVCALDGSNSSYLSPSTADPKAVITLPTDRERRLLGVEATITNADIVETIVSDENNTVISTEVR